MNQSSIPYGIIESPTQLGAAIRAKRRADGLSQGQLAGLCGVGLRFLSELERGKASAEVGKVLAVLAGLGLVVTVAPRGLPAKASGRAAS